MKPRRCAVVFAVLATLGGIACGSSSPPAAGAPDASGRLRVTVSVDWEGAYLSDAGLAALAALNKSHPDVPITHWVCPAYFTKTTVAPDTARRLRAAIRPIDEVALHIHAWHSLTRAAGVSPKSGPSFFAEGAELLEFEDGDSGFELEISAYSEAEFQAIVRTATALLKKANLDPVRMFRGAAGLVEPHTFNALAAEGYRVDSSALPIQFWRQDHGVPAYMRQRVQEIWGDLDDFVAPRWIDTKHGKVLEIPAPPGIADYTSEKQFLDYVAKAVTRLEREPSKDVYVHLGLHQETANETTEVAPHTFAERIDRTLSAIARRYGDIVVFELMSATARRHGAKL